MTPGASSSRPVVAIVCDRVRVFQHDAHAAFDGYVRAVTDAMQGLPLLLPAAGAAIDHVALLDAVDGLLLTGSPSNVQPSCYGGAPDPAMHLDVARDETTLAAIPALAQAGLPLLGICRGLQEMNVAYGGTLHAQVHAQPGLQDHRVGGLERPLPQWYEDRHVVHVQPDGWLARVVRVPTLTVNSLHEQGIARLGRGLNVEARAGDGLVEAISVAAAPQFTLAVQWHPEMRIDDSAEARAIFAAFAEGCRARRVQRLRAAAPRASG